MAQCAKQVCYRDVIAIYRLLAWQLLTPDPNKRTYAENLRDAKRLPWWLVLAGTNSSTVRLAMKEGVKDIWLQCNEGDKQVLMLNNSGIVFFKRSKFGVTLGWKRLS